MISKQLREAIEDDVTDAYLNGARSAFADAPGLGVKSYEQDDYDLDDIRILQNNGPLGMALGQFERDLNNEMNKVIFEAAALEVVMSTMVDQVRAVANTQAWKLGRIARTEMLNVFNEGRFRGYAKAEEILGDRFKYGLQIINDNRTCGAHQELSGRIPAGGLFLDELIQLQQSIGASFNMTLTGKALLHPNQRTVLVMVR
jgi:hypothetical protein